MSCNSCCNVGTNSLCIKAQNTPRPRICCTQPIDFCCLNPVVPFIAPWDCCVLRANQKEPLTYQQYVYLTNTNNYYLLNQNQWSGSLDSAHLNRIYYYYK